MKLCECGCGLPAPVAKRNDSSIKLVKGQPRRFVNGHNNRHRTGVKHPRWKGGTKTVSGYAMIPAKGHPRADTRGYVREHILIVERVLGYYLSKPHEVHHVNEIKDDNRNGNLVVCENRTYHALLHIRGRALKKQREKQNER